jgi:protein tyrosine phosphatase (PTP) superfamily phosphohydrolase (DUF442 family)
MPNEMQNDLPSLPRTVLVVAGLAIIAAGFVLSAGSPQTAVESQAGPIAQAHRAGLENLWRLDLAGGTILYSGSQPEGETGFASLADLGVKTVLTVDGAAPDVEAARRAGMRYVHVPIGYDDVPDDRLATMVAAVRQLPGPVYVHCHHGQHRGPSSAVCIWRALDRRVTADQAVQALHEMGTAEKYRGLYAAARRPFSDPDTPPGQIEFPEIAPVPPLTEQMAGIDRAWDRFKSADPSSEEILPLIVDLAERFKEAARLSEDLDAERDPELVRELQTTADFLETRTPADPFEETRSHLDSRCQSCHKQFRD